MSKGRLYRSWMCPRLFLVVNTMRHWYISWWLLIRQMPVKGLVRKKIARRFAILLKSLFVKKERVTLALV